MSPGFLYALQNKAFGTNVIKIGLTKRKPDVRARELYAGHSGVPLPFDIAVAYTVVDCELAEKIAHRRLRVFRLNNRREFFRISAAVGSSVAHRACASVNRDFGAPEPERFDFPAHSASVKRENSVLDDDDDEDRSPVHLIHLRRLRESPPGTSLLSPDQAERAEILCSLLTKLNPVARDKWLEGFTRDENPESEIRIWEEVAKAYLTLENADDATDGFRSEAFALLLERTWSSTSEVLSGRELKHFSVKNAKRLLEAYELRPKPLTVRRD